MAQDDDLDLRFRQAIARLLPGFDSDDSILGLAVSGGPDSLALLLLAHQAFAGRIRAASVDHGLRPAAKDEAEFVARLCEEREIPHEILRPTIPIRGSIQTVARQTRYHLLHDWMQHQGIRNLATAHHADDQLETMIMRILRGSGVNGLSGIRERRGDIIRPLLDFRKAELEEFLRRRGIRAVDDPSNRDQSFDRVRVRNALSELDGFDSRLASQSAIAVDDARAALDWVVDQLVERHVVKHGGRVTLEKTEFPHELQRRLLIRCLHVIDDALSPRGEQIEATIAALQKGETVTLGNILCSGGNKWRFSEAPSRNSG